LLDAQWKKASTNKEIVNIDKHYTKEREVQTNSQNLNNDSAKG